MTDHTEDDEIEVVVELERADERHPLESEETLREPREINEDADEEYEGAPKPASNVWEIVWSGRNRVIRPHG